MNEALTEEVRLENLSISHTAYMFIRVFVYLHVTYFNGPSVFSPQCITHVLKHDTQTTRLFINLTNIISVVKTKVFIYLLYVYSLSTINTKNK